MAHALFFRHRQHGFALFELGPHLAMIYEVLRGQLSSALQGAQLLDQAQNRAVRVWNVLGRPLPPAIES